LRQTGVDVPRLGEALAAWAKEGFPTGATLRRVPAVRALGPARAPRPCGVLLDRVVAMTIGIDGGRPARAGRGDTVWRLPWPTEMRFRAGSRRPGAGRTGGCPSATPGLFSSAPARTLVS
jgi:hypothetical protein